MKCPQCGKEMRPGFLQTENLVAFNQRRHRVSLNPRDEGDIMIANRAFHAADFHGFVCEACGLVTFDYKNVLFHL